MTDAQQITYADLRDGDVLVDKSGGRWHVSDVTFEAVKSDDTRDITFWLGDARTKVRLHHMTKPAGDPVTVERPAEGRESSSERIATHAADATALEDPWRTPDPSSAPTVTDGGGSQMTSEAKGAATPGLSTTLAGTGDLEPVSHEAAVAEVVEQLGGRVEAESSAAEIDAAKQATEDDPVVLPLFESMTDLEQRSHLFVLHGLFVDDLDDRKTRADVHAKAHEQRAQGKLRGRHTPHVHQDAK